MDASRRSYAVQGGLDPSEDGFAVGCPELPGYWSQGATEEEALENIKAAIVDYLEVVAEMNQRKETRWVDVVAF